MIFRIAFFIREAFRALGRSAAPSVAAIVTIVVTALLIGVLIPVLQATRGKTNEVRNQIELKVFLYDDATRAEIAALGDRIDKIRHVQSVDFISKQEALRILQGRLKDKTLLDELAGNPLPASFRVKLDDPDRVDSVRAALQPPNARGKPTPVSPIIEDVRASDTADKILSVTGALRLILAVITGLLVLASLLLVANTVRLSIYARRREVEVMRLVGATDWFIRWPFVIEGLMVGFLGGVAAVALLWLGKLTVIDPLAERFVLVAAQDTIPFISLVLVLIASSMVVAAIGSGITLRRFLRV